MKSPVFPPEKQLDLSSAVNSMSTSNNEQAQLLDHESSIQVTLPVESKGRGRTSAVVLGLALSMGTTSLLLPLQTKKALAFDAPAENKALEVATSSPVSTPSPIASPVPSALELAISTATGVNAVPSPAGFTTVSPVSEGLVSLSQQSLATPTPIALPTPLATPTQDLQVAATVEPTVAPTVEELSQAAPVQETEAAQTPESQPSQAAIATTAQPALPAPVPSHTATPAPEAETPGLTISNSLSLVSPTPEATPVVTNTPEALATLPSEPAPSIAPPTATPSIEAAQPIAPVQSAAVPQAPALVESSKLVELSVHSVELLKGTSVAVLPQLKQLQSEVASVPSVTLPAASLNATPAPSLNATLPQTPVESAVPTLIAQVPSTPLTEAATPIEASSPALTALLDAQPASQPLSSGSSLLPEANTLPNGLSYRVNRGDTLNVIARRYGVSVAELVSANNLVNPNSIEVDQEIRIPSPQNLHINANLVRSTTETVASLSPVAVPASLATPAAQTDLSAATSTNYIQNLKAEIEALQRKYQPQAAMAMAAPGLASPQLVTTPVVAATQTKTVEPINPEYASAQTAAVQAKVQTTVIRPLPVPQMPSQLMASQVQRVAVSPTLEPQQSLRVAAAPLAPTTYIPTIESTGGASVSPQLPPLAAAETYLPGDKTNFKGYIWPAKGVLTSGYGWRWGRMHRGVDIAGPTGTPILAAATGIIEYAQWNSGGYGYLVDIRHPDGSLTRYGHNSRILVREGQRVQQGQLISEMGSTGFSTGPHLHFEIHPANQGAVNPMAFLPRTSPG